MGAAKVNCAGMSASSAGFCENRYATNISDRITRPIQNAEKLPATRPDRTFSDAPPWPEALVTSRTWRELVLTKIFVNSMMSAPASEPHATMADSTHQRFGCATPSASMKSPSSTLVAPKQTMMDTMDVIQTRSVSGASQLKFFLPP